MILVVLPVCVHVPPLILIVEAEDFPCISFPLPATKSPAVNVKFPKRKFELVVTAPDALLISTSSKIVLAVKPTIPWLPEPEKISFPPADQGEK